MPENNTSSLFHSSEETTSPEVAQINGIIPSWLNGNFIRTGPGKWDFEQNFTMNHWFDGFAILSKFLINSESQTITFEKKFLKSDAYKRGIAAQKPVITEFGTKAHSDPNKSFFSRFLSACLPIELSDNDSINLFTLGDKLFVTSETCYFREIECCCLSTGEKFDSNKYFGTNIASAHPQIDSETGITYNIGCTVLPLSLKYNIFAIPPSNPNDQPTTKDVLKKSQILATIPSSHTGLLSYNHSFGMSQNYIIFIEQPYVMNITKAAKTVLKGSPVFKDFVEWRPELKNKFYLIEKQSGNVIKMEYVSQTNFFYLHVVNAYEEDDQIVIDLITYKNADFFDATYLSNLRDGVIHGEAFQGTTVRYVLPILDMTTSSAPMNINLVSLKTEATALKPTDKNLLILTPEILSLPGLESPIINKNYFSRKYKYFYSSGVYGTHDFSNSIVKYDVRKKEFKTWTGNNNQYPGEPQFVQNPSSNPNNGDYEEDGVLMSIVCEASPTKNDFIVFLNAKNMEELGRAQFQNHVPVACHGIYLPSSPLDCGKCNC